MGGGGLGPGSIDQGLNPPPTCLVSALHARLPNQNAWQTMFVLAHKGMAGTLESGKGADSLITFTPTWLGGASTTQTIPHLELVPEPPFGAVGLGLIWQ